MRSNWLREFKIPVPLRGRLRRRLWSIGCRIVICVGLIHLCWMVPLRAAPPEDATPATIPTRNLLAILRDGGLLMVPIGACSCTLGVFLLERFVSLRRSRVIPRPFVQRFLQQLQEGQLDRASALHLCQTNHSPVSEVFAAAVKKWGRPAVEVEQAVIDESERVSCRLRRYLRIFHFIATVAPLLGLLGTVLGMIQAFNVLATCDAAGRAQLLASGIGQALITTAAGLLVAIPALTAYSWFVARVDRLIMEIDTFAQQVVDSVAAEGLAATRHDKNPTRRAA